MNRFLAFYYRKIKPVFLRKPLATKASEVPFFILSPGRSGSTLLRKLMITNTFVIIPPESDDLLPKLIKFYLRYNHKPWEYIVRNCADVFNKEPNIIYWKSELKGEDLHVLSSGSYKDKSLAGIIHFFYNHYGKVHLQEFQKWGDKTPFLIFRLQWINLIFPSARYIFLIRDARAVVNSYLKMHKGYNLERASNRWLDAIKAMEKQEKTIGEEQVLYVKYEDLVQQPDIVIKKICSFLHLKPRPVHLNNFYLGDDVLEHHQNVQSEINVAYMNKWETELSQVDIAWITEKTREKLRKWGYI